MEFSLILNSEIISLAIRSATSSDPEALDLTVLCFWMKALIIPLPRDHSNQYSPPLCCVNMTCQDQ